MLPKLEKGCRTFFPVKANAIYIPARFINNGITLMIDFSQEQYLHASLNNCFSLFIEGRYNDNCDNISQMSILLNSIHTVLICLKITQSIRIVCLLRFTGI